jgi:isovaleryl-CoA dehydrogenase
MGPGTTIDATTGAVPASYWDGLEDVAGGAVDAGAAAADAGVFPRGSLEALASCGALGLVSSLEVGGLGGGFGDAARTIERVAASCASTALVLTMHYCATAVIEAHGDEDTRRAVAAGRHLGTLAFSEVGSRSHFWVPLSTATAEDGHVLLDARKSWVTSAGEADSYVWSSRPAAAEGLSSLWLVPAGIPGLEVTGGFDGLGLRGNASRPMAATGVRALLSARLGPDGGGFEIMMGVVLPWFQVLSAAASVGIMEAATRRTAAHATASRLDHLGQSLADQPLTRAHIARMRIATDQARALLLDTVAALEQGRPDAQLRVLEVKAVGAESAIAVTDLAMRVCGGAAYRKEVGVERHFRDARASTVMAPTTDVLLDFIGKAACGLPLF